NESNNQRLWGAPNIADYVKDGINAFVVDGRLDTVNPEQFGTKVAADYLVDVPSGGSRRLRLRLSAADAQPYDTDCAEVMELRQREADEFSETTASPTMSADQRNVVRQAFAGLLWSKQYYSFDVAQWLSAHGVDPYARDGHSDGMRNAQWPHLVGDD